MAGGARPGAGRPFGARNKKTIEREIVEQAALEWRIAARVIAPMQGKATLDRLLGIALERMHAAMAGGKETYDAFLLWYDRTFLTARELAKYQSPQLRAVAVAHTPISRPPAYDLTRLSERQLQQLRRLLVLASPSTLAYADRQKVANGGSIKRNEMGCDRTKPLVSDCGVSRSAGLVGGVQTGSAAAAAPSLMRRNGRTAATPLALRNCGRRG